MGWMNAWKKINPWNGGLSQVSCPVTVKQGSKVAYTSCDLRAELSLGIIFKYAIRIYNQTTYDRQTSFVERNGKR